MTFAVFKYFKRRQKSFPPLRDIVETVIRNHPKDCVFAPGAIDRIVNRAKVAHSTGDTFILVDVLEIAIRNEEIYCPHEGIDRRAEHGLA